MTASCAAAAMPRICCAARARGSRADALTWRSSNTHNVCLWTTATRALVATARASRHSVTSAAGVCHPASHSTAALPIVFHSCAFSSRSDALFAGHSAGQDRAGAAHDGQVGEEDTPQLRGRSDGDSGDDDGRNPRKGRREALLTVPNVLTFARLAMTPIIGHLIVTEQWNSALGLV
jgi:hypothetical protein